MPDEVFSRHRQPQLAASETVQEGGVTRRSALRMTLSGRAATPWACPLPESRTPRRTAQLIKATVQRCAFINIPLFSCELALAERPETVTRLFHTR